MSQTPLRLETYFFPKVQIEANPEYSPKDAQEHGDVQVKMNVGLLASDQDKTRFQLVLDIESIGTETGILPYRVSLGAVAFIAVDGDLKHPDIERLVQINGASMLYSAIREMVLMVTGRGPWGAFPLPTVNFQTVIPPSSSARKASDKTAMSAQAAASDK